MMPSGLMGCRGRKKHGHKKDNCLPLTTGRIGVLPSVVLDQETTEGLESVVKVKDVDDGVKPW